MAEPKTETGLKRSSTFRLKPYDRDEIFFHKFSLQHIIKEPKPLVQRKTRIICTLGYD